MGSLEVGLSDDLNLLTDMYRGRVPQFKHTIHHPKRSKLFLLSSKEIPVQTLESMVRGRSWEDVEFIFDGEQRKKSGNIPQLHHTNDILEYFGFSDGLERASFLKSFNQDYRHGADVAKAAYHVAARAGLTGNYADTPPENKTKYMEIAGLAHRNGEETASFVINRLGLEKAAKVFLRIEGYSVVNLGNTESLVPRGHIDFINEKLGIIGVNSSNAQSLMNKLGYEQRIIESIPVYIPKRVKIPPPNNYFTSILVH